MLTTQPPTHQAETQPLPTEDKAVGQSYTRQFNRYELKYLVHYEQAQALLASIDPYIQKDRHNTAHGQYHIVSLYYDSPDLTAFWEKLDGIKFRRKLRVRRYANDPGNQAYLEIKQRLDRTVQKRRAQGDADDFIRLLAGHDLPENANGLHLDPVCQEAMWLKHSCKLRPQVLVSYYREAYFGVYEKGLRITLDKNVRWSPYRHKLSCDTRCFNPLIPHSMFVLEIKCNNSIPVWLCTALNCLNLHIDRFSKYCGAINQMHYQGSLL